MVFCQLYAAFATAALMASCAAMTTVSERPGCTQSAVRKKAQGGQRRTSTTFGAGSVAGIGAAAAGAGAGTGTGTEWGGGKGTVAVADTCQETSGCSERCKRGRKVSATASRALAACTHARTWSRCCGRRAAARPGRAARRLWAGAKVTVPAGQLRLLARTRAGAAAVAVALRSMVAGMAVAFCALYAAKRHLKGKRWALLCV